MKASLRTRINNQNGDVHFEEIILFIQKSLVPSEISPKSIQHVQQNKTIKPPKFFSQQLPSNYSLRVYKTQYM